MLVQAGPSKLQGVYGEAVRCSGHQIFAMAVVCFDGENYEKRMISVELAAIGFLGFAGDTGRVQKDSVAQTSEVTTRTFPPVGSLSSTAVAALSLIIAIVSGVAAERQCKCRDQESELVSIARTGAESRGSENSDRRQLHPSMRRSLRGTRTSETF